MKYRDNEFFDADSTYLFETRTGGDTFKSKVKFKNGYWWTVEPLNYKCTSVRCKKVSK